MGVLGNRLWANEHMGKWAYEATGIWNNEYMGQWHLRKGACGKNGHMEQWACGKMGVEANGHMRRNEPLEKEAYGAMSIWVDGRMGQQMYERQ